MEDKKPRILIVGPRGLFGNEGGIEKFTDAFIPRALKEVDIDVLCLIKPQISLPDGLKVYIVPRSKYFKTDKALYLVYAFYLNAIHRYDHVFIFGTNLAVLILALKMTFWRRPKILLRSGSIDHTLKKWGYVMSLLLRSTEKLVRYADNVISVAPNIQKHLLTLGIKSHLVRNGLDFTHRASNDIKPKENTVIAIGRITAQKNYSVLIAASHHLGNDGPEIKIIGGADLSDEMEQLKDLCIQNPLSKINFTGVMNREIVISELRKSSLYINCSVHEGMSNAVLEAIQEGVPVILSDIEANRDLGLDDHFYFSPHNSEELSNKIKDALVHPQKYIVPHDKFEDWDGVIKRILTITGIKK